jgi:hypothetical protein
MQIKIIDKSTGKEVENYHYSRQLGGETVTTLHVIKGVTLDGDSFIIIYSGSLKYCPIDHTKYEIRIEE